MKQAWTPLIALGLAACQPPAADDYVERTRIDNVAEAPSEPIGSPNTEGAVWASASGGDRILYGQPGEQPLLALECVAGNNRPRIAFTRFAAADPHAKAILALIGNGHVSRMFVDAQRSNRRWLWQGEADAHDPRLDVFTGRRNIEATVPGAGSVILNPSQLPGDLVERCRTLLKGEPFPPTDQG